jgi:hypothetical protein
VLKVTSDRGGAKCGMVYDAEDFLAGLFRPAAVGNVGPDDLPPDWRQAYEERAAVMQFDAGLTKEHAEAAALRDTLRLMQADRWHKP